LNEVSIAPVIRVFCNLFVRENKSSLETAAIPHNFLKNELGDTDWTCCTYVGGGHVFDPF
jgi:hypothetical protein